MAQMISRRALLVESREIYRRVVFLVYTVRPERVSENQVAILIALFQKRRREGNDQLRRRVSSIGSLHR